MKNIPNNRPMRRWTYSQKKINLNWERVMLWFSFWYSGYCWYFSNSVSHSELFMGGITPEMGCHSTIESPDWVRRVTPPIITIRKMSRQAEMSQVVICFFVFGSIYEVYRQEKLVMKWLCVKQSIFFIYHFLFSFEQRQV